MYTGYNVLISRITVLILPKNSHNLRPMKALRSTFQYYETFLNFQTIFIQRVILKPLPWVHFCALF